jgi:SAM-dependent methyltransferase
MTQPDGASTMPATPETLLRYRSAAYAPFALLAASQLDLFTALRDGPRSATQLAEGIGAGPDKLSLLLYALLHAGLLEKKGDDFANTAESQHFLARGGPGFVGDWWKLDQDFWHAAMKTAATLRAGKPQALHDFANMSEAEMADFFGGLHGFALSTGRFLADRPEFANFTTLIDVGGGSGGVPIAACQAHPELRATIVELPRVLPIAINAIAAAGLSDRIEVIEADIVAASPPGRYDAAVMRALIQVMGREEAARAIANIRPALRPGGWLYILSHIVDDTRVAPATAVGFNLVFLNIYNAGEAYSEGEYRAWLADGGFADVTIAYGVVPGGMSLVSARNP